MKRLIELSLFKSRKEKIKRFLWCTSFRPVHIGQYSREKYLFRHLQALCVRQCHKVLDAGCGPGIYTRRLAAAYPHMEVTGLDVEEFASWNKLARNVQFIRQDLTQLSEENHYDFSLCIHVLEHIPGNKLVLEKIYRSLEPGGYFCRHMPDDKHSRRIFPKKFFKEFEKWVEDEHIGEQYTFEEMKNVFRSTGSAIIEAHNVFGYWGKLAWEFDRITDGKIVFKILLMALLKAFAHFDLWFPKLGESAICLVDQKSVPNNNDPGITLRSIERTILTER